METSTGELGLRLFSRHPPPVICHLAATTPSPFPRDLSYTHCQPAPTPSAPALPLPQLQAPAPAACLRHLIQGQPGLPPSSLLRAVTHSPCRLSASMSSPRTCDSVG